MSLHRVASHDRSNNTTVPDDYDDLLSYYTKRGYRVIAIAGKSVENLTWLKAQKMKRFVATVMHFSIFIHCGRAESKQNQACSS